MTVSQAVREYFDRQSGHSVYVRGRDAFYSYGDDKHLTFPTTRDHAARWIAYRRTLLTTDQRFFGTAPSVPIRGTLYRTRPATIPHLPADAYADPSKLVLHNREGIVRHSGTDASGCTWLEYAVEALNPDDTTACTICGYLLVTDGYVNMDDGSETVCAEHVTWDERTDALFTGVGAIRGESLPAYAWPGGYPIVYLTRDGSSVCAECATEVGTSDPAVGYYSPGNDSDPDPAGTRCEGCNREIVEPDDSTDPEPVTEWDGSAVGLSTEQVGALLARLASDGPSAALALANDLIGGYGVEYAYATDDPLKYGRDPMGLEYVNVGDPYRATIIYNHATGDLIIGRAWGDIVERGGYV